MRPRRLTPDDLDNWFDAVKDGQSTPPRPKDLAALRAHVARQSPFIWNRWNRDYKRIGKILKKLGMNPEDARWLL